MEHGGFVLVAAFLLAYGLVSRRLERTPLTAPILAVAFGIALGPLGFDALGFDVRDGTMRLLAEFTLALVLFHDAARIDLRMLRRNLGTPERLLGPGLVGTILLGTVVGLFLFPEWSPWEVALLAAMLAPTDAALGQAVVTQETVPARVRQALNVESGLNDGLVVPVVAVTMACAASGVLMGGVGASIDTSAGGEGLSDVGDWIRHAAKAAGFGVGVGVVVGLVAARLLDRAHALGWMRDGARHVSIAAVPVLAFFLAEWLHGSGFLAAFVGGLALGSTTRYVGRDAYEFTEDAGDVFGHVTWIAFGAAAAPAALECATAEAIGYALLSLTVVRMAPVALGLLGAGFRRDSVLFIGWFGPRGLATVVFAASALGAEGVPHREGLFGVAVWTVLLSVLLHGATAGWLARAYGARCAARAGGERVAESVPVPAPHPMRRRAR